MTQASEDTVLSLFTTHSAADAAIKELAAQGFDMTKLSIVGKGYHSEENAIGFYSTGDRIKSWGATGAFWGGVWGLLVGPALFLVPGVGLVALAGPFVATLVAGIEGALIGGGVSAIGAALAQLGLSKDQVVKYETALRADGFLLIVHGDADDVSKARAILDESQQSLPHSQPDTAAASAPEPNNETVQ
jgi:hypothetical protein